MAITGAQTNAIVKIATTHGTAVAGGAGDKVTGKINRSLNPTILRPSPIGEGLDMDSMTEVSATDPVVTIDSEDRFDGGLVAAEALLFGGTSISDGAAAWTQSFVYDGTRNQRFCTVAFEGFSAGVFEYPSATPRRVTVTGAPNQYVTKQVEFLCDKQVLNSATNTNATLQASTVATTVRQVAKPDDYVLINAQAGDGLSTTTDSIAVTQWSVEYGYDVQHIPEIKGSAGNGTPVSSGDAPFQASVTLTFKNLADFTYFTAQAAGTEYKMELRVTSDTNITGSIPYEVRRYFPRLIVVQDPQYSLANAGENPLTVTFKALVAASVPTGMFSIYPAVTYRNAKSARYTA